MWMLSGNENAFDEKCDETMLPKWIKLECKQNYYDVNIDFIFHSIWIFYSIHFSD